MSIFVYVCVSVCFCPDFYLVLPVFCYKSKRKTEAPPRIGVPCGGENVFYFLLQLLNGHTHTRTDKHIAHIDLWYEYGTRAPLAATK